MSRCLLCLQNKADLNDYIPKNSSKWLQLKIQSTIEKHFWPIDNVQNILGICYFCWAKLNDFHTFFTIIEEAHSKIALKDNCELNCSLKVDIFEINSPQVRKVDLTATKESNFNINDNIQIEGTPKENEELISVVETKKTEAMDSSSLVTEKRKRGRPRKFFSENETIVSKPKGKRGRPPKYIYNKHTNIIPFRTEKSNTYAQIANTNESQSTNDQDIAAESPPKIKRSRGRPRKIQTDTTQQIESLNSTTTIHDVATPLKEVVIEKQCSAKEEGDMCLNLNGPEKLVNKKQPLYSILKRRKRIRQHKALMRHYIATSMRCMKFLKK